MAVLSKVKMLKLCFGVLLFILFFCINTANAQSYDLYSIKLKSGLILKCELVNIIPDSFVTIRQYGNVSRIKCSEIIWIEYSGYKKIDSAYNTPYVRPKVILRKLPDSLWTYGLQLSLNLNFGGPYEETAGTQIKFIAMKGVRKGLEAGFCLGFDL